MSTLLSPNAPGLARRYAHLHLGFIVVVAEMILASSLGMAAGYLVGIPQITSPEVRAVLWLAAMSVPMVVWMAVRRHNRRCMAEMTAAMAIPMIATVPLYWLGAISGTAWISFQHCWMVPTMVAWMVHRRRLFGW